MNNNNNAPINVNPVGRGGGSERMGQGFDARDYPPQPVGLLIVGSDPGPRGRDI